MIALTPELGMVACQQSLCAPLSDMLLPNWSAQVKDIPGPSPLVHILADTCIRACAVQSQED